MRSNSALAHVGIALFTFALLCCSGGSPAVPSGSSSGSNPDGGGDGAVGACSPADTASIQRTLFAPKCALAGCHTGSDPSGSIAFDLPSLETSLSQRASNECGGQTLVVAGDPDASYLLHKLTDEKPACGTRMPQGGPFFGSDDIACVRAWISGLAKPADAGVDSGPTCPGGETACSAGCTDTKIDKNNCGNCGTVCPVACSEGTCVTSCPGTTTNCGGSCVDTTTSTAHCGGCGSPCTGGKVCVASSCTCGAAVAFKTEIEGPILVASCAVTGCHRGVQPKGGLSLESGKAYGELVDIASSTCNAGARTLVTPGDVSKSYLVNKLTGVDMCAGTQMPKAGSALPAGELDTIRRWICNGAPNN